MVKFALLILRRPNAGLLAEHIRPAVVSVVFWHVFSRNEICRPKPLLSLLETFEYGFGFPEHESQLLVRLDILFAPEAHPADVRVDRDPFAALDIDDFRHFQTKPNSPVFLLRRVMPQITIA